MQDNRQCQILLVVPVRRLVAQGAIILLSNMDASDRFGRDSADDGVGRDIARDHRPCRDDGVAADGYALQNRGVRTDPDVSSERDRRRVGRLAVSGGKAVVERGEDDVVSDLAVIADGYASVVLKVAAGVDEYTAADADVFPEIGIERRKDAQRGIGRLPEQLGEQCPHLVGRMIGAVQLEGDAPRFAAYLVHETVYLGRIERPACRCVFQKFGECHRYADV